VKEVQSDAVCVVRNAQGFNRFQYHLGHVPKGEITNAPRSFHDAGMQEQGNASRGRIEAPRRGL
jgi:hypothetical protein